MLLCFLGCDPAVDHIYQCLAAAAQKLGHIRQAVKVELHCVKAAALVFQPAEIHGISDLGYGFVPENFNAYVVDNVVAVNTTDAQRAAQKVLRTDAIPASVASGAVLQAAAQLIHVGASRSALAILPGRQIVNTL